MSQEKVTCDLTPKAVGPYSAAIKIGNMVYVSGQLPIDASIGKMPEDITAQTKQSLKNLSLLLEAAGSSIKKVVKTTVLLSDIKNFAPMNEVYGQVFSDPFPARSAFEVGALPLGALVEIECVAYIDD